MLVVNSLLCIFQAALDSEFHGSSGRDQRRVGQRTPLLQLLLGLRIRVNNYLSYSILSLSSRSHVKMVDQVYEQNRGDNWVVVDASLDRPFIGKVRPRPIHSTHEELVELIGLSLPQLVEDSETRKRGLVTALRLFCSTYEFDYGEPLYLKTWMTLEVLYGKFSGNAKIINDKAFKLLRSRISEYLRSDSNEDLLSEGSIVAIEAKLSELQRYSAKHQVEHFFKSVFAGVEDLIPSAEEFSRFSRVRNQITHTGSYTPEEEESYNREIYDLRRQLSALLESVFLALLGSDATKVEPDWRNAIRRGSTDADD